MTQQQVWILTYLNPANNYGRKIFGVYNSEGAANDALNDGLFAPLYDEDCDSTIEQQIEGLYVELKPQIEEFIIHK